MATVWSIAGEDIASVSIQTQWDAGPGALEAFGDYEFPRQTPTGCVDWVRYLHQSSQNGRSSESASMPKQDRTRL